MWESLLWKRILMTISDSQFWQQSVKCFGRENVWLIAAYSKAPLAPCFCVCDPPYAKNSTSGKLFVTTLDCPRAHAQWQNSSIACYDLRLLYTQEDEPLVQLPYMLYTGADPPLAWFWWATTSIHALLSWFEGVWWLFCNYSSYAFLWERRHLQAIPSFSALAL